MSRREPGRTSPCGAIPPGLRADSRIRTDKPEIGVRSGLFPVRPSAHRRARWFERSEGDSRLLQVFGPGRRSTRHLARRSAGIRCYLSTGASLAPARDRSYGHDAQRLPGAHDHSHLEPFGRGEKILPAPPRSPRSPQHSARSNDLPQTSAAAPTSDDEVVHRGAQPTARPSADRLRHRRPRGW